MNTEKTRPKRSTDLLTPISIEFRGQARSRFETVLDDNLAARAVKRYRSRLKIRTTEEATALLSTLEDLDLLEFDHQNISTLHRVRDELEQALAARGYALEDGELQEQDLLEGAEVPQSFEVLTGTCETCDADVDSHRLTDGECPGCAYGDLAPDGGLHTVEHDGTEYVVCHMVAFESDADLDVEYEDGDPRVTNHDEVRTYNEVRLLPLEMVEESGLHEMAISPQASLWREEFTSLEPGDAIRVDELTTDGGGPSWYDLTAFQRDLLKVIAEAQDETCEPPHGLGIKAELETRYTEEINHGRLYPNLDRLAAHDLVEKGTRDRRTNYYRLAPAGTALLQAEKESWEDLSLSKLAVADGGEA